MHKFNQTNKSKLDNEWRREVLPPGEVLARLGLNQNDIVADIGCGIGYFTIPAAGTVEPNRVYALDISEDMLEEVERRVRIADVKNVITVQTLEYDFKLPDNGVTFGLMVNVLHETGDRKLLLSEASRIVRTGGKLAIVEWDKSNTEYGPPPDHRVARDEIKRLLADNGFDIHAEHDIGGIFYGVTAVKK